MTTNIKRREFCTLAGCVLAGSIPMLGSHQLKTALANQLSAETDPNNLTQAEQILQHMTLDEKLSQMIIPAIRAWNGENVTNLEAAPELAEALRKHQYCGIILYGSNVSGTEQTARLIYDLQVNNASIEGVSASIPYLMPVDQEGGIVARLTTGTRMNGNMAIGATGEQAAENAYKTGQVIGEELAALGFNANFAPDIDVNNNAANPVIGTRSFSDDPDTVARLGVAYTEGLAQSRIIGTYKHFPGHGDTGTDSHIGTATVNKTYEQLLETELVPFEAALQNGADMIMTAHITLPLIDEEKTFGDGETKGYYPATMSHKIITEILRGNLGYDGVVVTDALEMGAILSARLVPGEENSTEYRINIAEQVINAGVDILLLPLDMTNPEAVAFYDDYIEGLAQKIAERTISEDLVNQSVLRILKLKEKYGILSMDALNSDIEKTVQKALETVGSDAHHATEMDIALHAMTLLKNEGALPAKGAGSRIVFAGRQADDSKTIVYALRQLMDQGVIDPAARLVNLVSGEITGSEDATCTITVDYYYDLSGTNPELHYTDELKAAIASADLAVCITRTFSTSAMADTFITHQGISSIISDAHTAGAKAVLLSDNLPYDSARYQDADAIILAYMGSGLNMDPTARADGSANMEAYNANVVAAISLIFGNGSFAGILPVNIPVIEEQDDGSLVYLDQILYERGFGLAG